MIINMARDARGVGPPAAEEPDVCWLLVPPSDPVKTAAQMGMKEEEKSVVCMFFLFLCVFI